MTKYILPIAIIVSFLLINSSRGDDVQLDFMLGDLKPWGGITLTEGKRVELRCIAKNSDSKGVFEWRIDDVLQQSDRPLRDMGNGVFEQSLEINTAIDLDQKEVECRYLDGATGEALQETFLTINVIHQKWPPQPYNAGEFVVGDQVSLTVPFELYPAPESSYLTWKVTDKSNQITELKPGENDATSHFKAQNLKELGNNRYNATLTIDSVTENDAATSIQLVVKTDPKNQPHTVDVTFSLRLTREAAKTEEASPQPEASTMSVGVWVIVAIIILIAAIIIGYCIYQKKCAKGNENEGYQPPKDQREAENPA